MQVKIAGANEGVAWRCIGDPKGPFRAWSKIFTTSTRDEMFERSIYIIYSAVDWSWWHRYFDSRFCCMDRVLRLVRSRCNHHHRSSYWSWIFSWFRTLSQQHWQGWFGSRLQGQRFGLGRYDLCHRTACLSYGEANCLGGTRGEEGHDCTLVFAIDIYWPLVSHAIFWNLTPTHDLTWHCTLEIKIILQQTRTWHLVPTIFFSIFEFIWLHFLTSLVSVFEEMTSPNESCPHTFPIH